ncbi:MAG: hypothetical protein U5K43_13630 [Halofilum sp. (in: g-proteobacteria)]|nr:hypothetical protein [Halofilum sp. (in: g-proteobacteria)]
MDADTVLLKSPRGREEIGTRAHALSPLARRLLIMADGRRSVAELAAELDRTARDDAVQEALQLLFDDGYLHVRDEYDERRAPAPDTATGFATA